MAVCTRSRSRLGSIASSSTLILPKPLARVSDCLVGRVGRCHVRICSGVTASRPNTISASGASSLSVSSIFSPALTPDGRRLRRLNHERARLFQGNRGIGPIVVHSTDSAGLQGLTPYHAVGT